MSFTKQLSRHISAMYFGPSLTGPNLQETLEDVNWQQATRQVHGLNTIAMLVFHINYYVTAVLKVLHGGPLDAHDKYSYAMPSIESEADWQALKDRCFEEAKMFSDLVSKLSDDQLSDLMAHEKYGNWFQNLLVLEEHSYYHLGQIVLLKKIVQYQQLMV